MVSRKLETEWQQRWLRLDRHHPKIQELADAVSTFAGSWFRFKLREPRQLVIVGNSGCGKSLTIRRFKAWADNHAMAWLDSNRLDHVADIRFLRWPEVADSVKNAEYGIIEDLITADLLFLDDVGAEHDTASRLAADKLCQLLSRRTDFSKKWTVITTNIQPSDWVSQFGERIADRLLRGSTIVDLTGVPSYAIL